jgi:transposase
MGKTIEEDRRCAAALRARGESPAAIAAALGRARSWVYKWLNRASADDATWNVSQSRAPHRRPRETTDAITEIISATRHRLRADGVFHGAQAIHWELQELSLPSIPSVRTIGRVLQRLDLVERRHGRYTPRGTRYPVLVASTPGAVHQSDFVGPCYGQRPLRFYSLHSVDLATGRCAVEPVTERAAQATIDAFWASWWRLGLPRRSRSTTRRCFMAVSDIPGGWAR